MTQMLQKIPSWAQLAISMGTILFMSEVAVNTESKILAAAEVVFHENGFKGTRTTLIAKRAGVSRTMLHYYFRTKEELFQKVLHNSFGFMLAHAQRLFEGQTDLKSLIDSIVDLLCDALTAKPSLPSFIVNILNESPEMLTAIPFIKEEQIPFLFDQLLVKARQQGQIHSTITGENLLLNIYGLCAIPYLTAPLIQFKENRSNEDMQLFLNDRKASIKSFVWNGIQNQ